MLPSLKRPAEGRWATVARDTLVLGQGQQHTKWVLPPDSDYYGNAVSARVLREGAGQSSLFERNCPNMYKKIVPEVL